MGRRKRRKSDPNQTLLQNLGDDLLLEILSRIPMTVLAIRCKLVCKRWCSLISSQYFVSRFKVQHMKHESRYPKPLSGMLASTARRVSIAEDSEFNFRGFNLDYLPTKYGNIMVLASCDDLIVCEDRKDVNICDYYLCNPFTMQWVALPPPPPLQLGRIIRYIRTGLVCEQYNDGSRGTADDRFRYRIVRFYIYDYDHELPVEMYCSETNEWIQWDALDKDYFWSESKIAAYNGKLYWVKGGGQYLIRYDPFDRTQPSLRLINGANRDQLSHMHRSHVGECEGVLRVARLEPSQRGSDPLISEGISLWELQEEEVIFKDHIVLSEDSYFGVAGFHPRNKDVLFLTSTDSIASFNTKTRELKVETQFKDRPSSRKAFTLQLPWWPTPVIPPASMT